MATQFEQMHIGDREQSTQKDRLESDRARRMADFELGAGHRELSISPESLPDPQVSAVVW
jgi:hypothetical protein